MEGTVKPGILLRPKHITRSDLQANPRTLYVFGDNTQRRGLGGQAKAMRGEPNAIGVPTKHDPSMREGAFFTDDDWDREAVLTRITATFDRLERHIDAGLDVAIPADGLGTGLAQLPQRAPKIAAYIESRIARLTEIASS